MTNGVSVRELVLDILMEVNEKEQYNGFLVYKMERKYL